MHNLSLKIYFSILLIVFLGVSVYGDVVPNEDTTSGNTLTDEYVGMCTGDNVRIRATASTNSAILSSNTSNGDKLVIIGTQGDWYQIILPEYISVWISRRYVDAKKGNINGTVIGQNVNLRSANTTNSTVVGKINKGANVEIVAAKGDWFLILPPKEAKGWISGKYVKRLGPYTNYLNELRVERNRYLQRAAAYYESKGQKDLAKAYQSLIGKSVIENGPKDDPIEKIRKAETAKYESFLLQYKSADSNEKTANVDALKILAQQIYDFAQTCKTEVKDQTMELHKEITEKIQEIEKYRKDIADAKTEADAIAKAKAEKERILEEVNIRLMRKNADKYVAKGVVTDQQLPDSGMTIYFLEVNGKQKYRLVAVNSEINIRKFWRREIGIVGKIVYDEDEEYPIILCEEVEVFNAK